jgi:hypothetical protein
MEKGIIQNAKIMQIQEKSCQFILIREFTKIPDTKNNFNKLIRRDPLREVFV